MELQEIIFDATDEQLRKRMREVGTTSPAWAGIVAELQYRAAEKMDRQTRALVRLTWAIAFLTLVLLVYTIKLDLGAARAERSTGPEHATSSQ
jgi:hypothetical protein